jgi:hypothetical protein
VDNYRPRPPMEGFSRPGSLGGEASDDDNVEGHIMSDDRNLDTEGHRLPRADAGDDTEGHRLPRADAGDDTEGHRLPRADEGDDTEGHRLPRADEGDDDTEGHAATIR